MIRGHLPSESEVFGVELIEGCARVGLAANGFPDNLLAARIPENKEKHPRFTWVQGRNN